MDSLLVPSGATREVTFVADVEGTYYYWGTTTGRTVNAREFEDSQLSGALIVDPTAPSDARKDRIFVFGSYLMAGLPTASATATASSSSSMDARGRSPSGWSTDSRIRSDGASSIQP
jgi:FtsP/CotA-like multicopper oxidase with cupredoxin domain